MKNGLFNLIVVVVAVSGQACLAKGKTLGPMQVPKFIEANNGLGVAAALRGGDFLSRVVLHFMGMDPAAQWVPPPKPGDLFPAWVDEPLAMPATAIAIGASSCGVSDYSHLAAALRADPPAVPSAAHPEGLIHVEAPPVPAIAPGPAAGDFGSREIYGRCD